MQAKLLRQPWLTFLTHAFFAWVTITFYHSIQESNEVDHATVDVYKVYGFIAIAMLIILSAWTAIKRKLLLRYILCGLFLVVNVWLYFTGLNKVENLPYQQRFVLKNDTPYLLTELTIFGDTTLNVGTLQPNQIAQVTYNNYVEN
jgi:glucan phosphoethanolaminetransferase (alkaline phosphatase superfamily)